jgi:hypothetical protein
MRALRRVGATGDRDDVLLADHLRERQGGRFVDVATRRRVAADEPYVEPGRRRVAQVREAPVPVAVLEKDRARRAEVELEEGLSLGEHVSVAPGWLGGADRGDRLLQRGDRQLPGSRRLQRDARQRQHRWIDQDQGRGPDPGRGEGCRRDRAPAMADDLELRTLETDYSDERGDVRGVVAETMVALPMTGQAVARLVDGDNVAPARCQGGPDPPPDPGGRRDAVDQQQWPAGRPAPPDR